MSDLFPAEQMAMDSPRLAWMKRLGVRVDHAPKCTENPFSAWFWENEENKLPVDPERCGYGQTEEEALRDLAVRNNTRLWNEEGHA